MIKPAVTPLVVAPLATTPLVMARLATTKPAMAMSERPANPRFAPLVVSL
jgi:hypothetical protein